MVTGTGNCPFCDEEVYCLESSECTCTGSPLSHWPIYEQYKCPHCGIFNMNIDRRSENMQKRLRSLQMVASEENIQANQNQKFIFWVDQPAEQAFCNPELKKAIKKGLFVVKQIQDFE